MKKIIGLGLVALLMMTGCSPCRNIISSETQQDSVRVEVRERTVFVPDTVIIEIPAQTAERTTPDSLSFLENDYAESTARINPDGTLFHNLKTKPQEKPIKFDKPIQQRDSIVYRDRLIKQTKTIKVARELTWWQKTQIYGFWGLIVFVVLLYTIKKIATHIREIRKK